MSQIFLKIYINKSRISFVTFMIKYNVKKYLFYLLARKLRQNYSLVINWPKICKIS